MVVLMVLVVIYRGMKRKTREQWFELVGKWKSSGLTARQFAKRHGVRESTFLSWSSKFNRSGFAPPRQGASVTASNCIEIIRRLLCKKGQQYAKCEFLRGKTGRQYDKAVSRR
ncbi:MAG: hypothetical protein D6806_06745 [Deltaproteobacteria bacterium]|nr:MAG: hypothetical protein D6806_06745 [Deltaproteobacteria bacterium]